MTNALVPVGDIEKMAKAFASSKLFGIQNVEQAMALMLIAQAEGNHPAIAARDYHVIQGKPALKADAMMARFQAAGGKVEWVEVTDAKVSAYFSHPQGGRILIDWDMKRAQQAQLGGNGMWSKYPRQMLRARVISEGIRTVFPGVIVGSYTEEEVRDFATIDGTSVQHPEETKPDLSIMSPDGMSKDDMKKLAVEADEALESVQDEGELNSWVDQYQNKCTKNLPASWMKKLDDKAVRVHAAVTKVA